MRTLWLILLFAGGCYHPLPPEGAPCQTEEECPRELSCLGGHCLHRQDIDAPVITDDVPLDAPPDGIPIDGCVTFSGQTNTCLLAPGSPMTLTGIEFIYTTGTGTLEQLDGNGAVIATTNPAHTVVQGKAGPIDVLLVSSFSLSPGSELSIVGTLPFGIVATQTITISGRIDGSGGAGRRSTQACGTSAGSSGTANATGGSGGSGGAMHSAGGAGGAGANSGAGATTALSSVPLGPLGGCSGGRGGAGTMAGSGGSGGSGGGAAYLVSAAMISVPSGGIIEAAGNGASGGGGAAGVGYLAGGGGGGSGGMIWLEAPQLAIHGIVVANGGGGGEASGSTAAGNAGQRGRQSTLAATGGAGADAAGGDGGAGSVSTTGATGGAGGTSGGGGGGGAGYIVLQGTKDLGGSTISPTPN